MRPARPPEARLMIRSVSTGLSVAQRQGPGHDTVREALNRGELTQKQAITA